MSGGVAVYGSTGATAPSGTFPGAADSSAQSQVQAIAAQLKTMTAGQFAADYGISSTEMPTYIDANGQFTQAAYTLAYYYSLGQAQRQSIQEQMVTVGLISASSATGARGGSALTAFKSLIGSTAAQGTDAITWLDANATPEAQIQSQISGNLTAAEKAAQAPEVITEANPTTLSAAITQAFMQTTGEAPDQAQIQAFISGVQGQYGQYGNAPRAAAQAEISQAHNEESALNALGPDGIDSVIKAYQRAVSGSGIAGAGTPQGPATGPSMADSPLGHTFAGATNEVGANVQPTGTTTRRTTMVPQGGIEGWLSGVAASTPFGGAEHTMVPQTTSKTTYRAPNLGQNAPAGVTWNGSTYGGTYALSQQDWKEAQTLYSPAKKYATPGAAPEAIQLGAFTNLLQNEYDDNGHSWSKAVASIASGTPFGTKEGTQLAAFGDQVAAQVNAQIASLQNEVNNSPVTVKVSAPDVNAEANLAAKQANPTGYYAANEASWGEVLNQMLQGAPQMFDQSSADTFTGPVQDAAMSGSGSTVG